MSQLYAISDDPDSTSNADELGAYRSLSTLAVAAFVLGLISPVVFISPLFVVIPLAGVGTALLALTKIRSSSDGLSGAGLAHFGLALAIVFGVAATAYLSVRNELFRRQADATAQHWLLLVSSNQTEKAVDMMTSAAMKRLSPSAPLGQRAIPVDRSQAVVLLQQDPLVQILATSKQQGQPIFTCREVTTTSNSDGTYVKCTYEMANSQAVPALILVALRRSERGKAEAVWLINQWAVE